MPESASAKLEELEAIFSALSHPARRQILMALHFRGEPMTAGDLAGRFAHAWPTTTRHVRLLEAAGLIVQTQRGRHRLYEVDRAKLRVVQRWVEWFFVGDGPGAGR